MEHATYIDRVMTIYKDMREEQALELVTMHQPYSGTGRIAGLNKGTRFALAAWEHAKLEVEFEIETIRGNVRLRKVPAEWSEDDLFGDMYKVELNDNVKPHIISRERDHDLARADAEGVWDLVGEIFDGVAWQHAGVTGPHLGDDLLYWDVRSSLLEDTLNAAKSLDRCTCCGRVKPPL